MFSSPRSSSTSVRRVGFTLVELLVVIGIIALLVSILLPTLSQARKSANKVVAGSNMRQIGQAAVFYANDNDGSLPYYFFDPARYTAVTGDTYNDFPYHWTDQLQSMIDEQASPVINTTNYVHHQNVNLSSRQIFQSPAVAGAGTEPAWLRMTHYGVHPDLFPLVEEGQQPGVLQKPYKLAQIDSSSSVGFLFEETLVQEGFAGAGGSTFIPAYDISRVLMVDGWGRRFGSGAAFEFSLKNAEAAGLNLGDSVSLANFGSPINSDDYGNTHTLAFRYGNRDQANLLFADGHVDTIRLSRTRGIGDPELTTLKRRNVYITDND